ncbi:hypothetical protein LVJ94_13215 [Pendulispora rubella]|uniref:Uncharacterized protein n=1 Tax=Pendulispora rubella TaxID=2741070 RepID=A0ABZ2LG90_9BACT
MATTTKESAPPVRTLADLRKDDVVDEDGGEWSGPKLAVLGVIALGLALVFLYTISPYSGIILP